MNSDTTITAGFIVHGASCAPMGWPLAGGINLAEDVDHVSDDRMYSGLGILSNSRKMLVSHLHSSENEDCLVFI